MEDNWKVLHSAFTGESFNCYIDTERNLLLHQPSYLLKENKWQITPNTNEANILNAFYKQYPNGVEGSQDECLTLIKSYKK